MNRYRTMPVGLLGPTGAARNIVVDDNELQAVSAG